MVSLGKRALPILAAMVGLAGTAMAQNATKPLNLKLPPGTSLSAPATASSAAAASKDSAVTARGLPALPPGVNEMPPPREDAAGVPQAASAGVPGTYYGDHSNTTAAGYDAEHTSRCDDYTYNKPQIHGSVTTGIVSGSHIGTGSYSGGMATLSKAFGSCDDPEGGVSISVGGTNSRGFGRR